MKKFFLYLTPFVLVVILFRFFNGAGHLDGNYFLNVIKDFDFDFDNTTKWLESVSNAWKDIDFFPIEVNSFATFFKAIGKFFVAIFDFLKAFGYSIATLFTLLVDFVEIFIKIFNILFQLFGFNVAIS